MKIDLKRIMKTFLFQRLSLTCIAVLITQSSAWAHAFLDHADPAVGSRISQAPTQVKIWFTQNLEPTFSSVQVQDTRGKEVDKKDAHVDSKKQSLLVVTLPKLPSGTYTVIWRVVSVDTHKTQGHFEFTIK
jgi:methionine-rich copper-binding protein CopC